MKAFSLIELLISLIIISIITAAFAPVVSKKMKRSSVALVNNISNKCMNDNCLLCYGHGDSSKCLICNKTCSAGYFLDSTACACKACNTKFSNCTACTFEGCTKCPAGYGLNSDGCSQCSSGYYSDGSTACKPCTSSTCSSCNSTTGACTGCAGGYMLSGSSCIKYCSKGYKVSANSCAACEAGTYQPYDNYTGTTCTPCTSSTCSSCNSTTGACTGCAGGYGLINGSCTLCSTYGSKCASCNSAGCVTCIAPYKNYAVLGINYCTVNLGTGGLIYNDSQMSGLIGSASINGTIQVVSPLSADCTREHCCWQQNDINKALCTLEAARKICVAKGGRLPYASELDEFNALNASVKSAIASQQALCSKNGGAGFSSCSTISNKCQINNVNKGLGDFGCLGYALFDSSGGCLKVENGSVNRCINDHKLDGLAVRCVFN